MTCTGRSSPWYQPWAWGSGHLKLDTICGHDDLPVEGGTCCAPSLSWVGCRPQVGKQQHTRSSS